MSHLRAHAGPGPATTPPRRGLGATLILATGTFAVGTDAFVVAGLLPDLAVELRVSTAAAGQSVTVFAIAYAILAPVLSTVTARLPRRTLLVAALLVLAAGNLLSAVADTLPVLVAGRIVAAAGAAAYTPNAGAVAASLVPPTLRGRALAVVIGGLTVATALGVPLGGLTARWLGWRAALVAVALLASAVAVAVRLAMPALPGGPAVPLRARSAALRQPAVLTVLPLTVIGMAASYTVYAFAAPTLGALGVDAYQVNLMLLLYGLGAVAGNVTSGYATDRWGAVPVLVVGYATMAVALGGLGAFSVTGSAPMPLVGLLVAGWGAASWCQTPAQQHRLISAAPQQAPLVVSLNSSAIYLGIGLGTTAGGAALASGVPAMYALGVAGALVALLVLRLGRRLAPQTPTP
ncbi:MFS transporter [Micromonospora rifamycinica]|uniref:Predicted arabinose efflux permease, MFS family n=1 Tax=Micromonospora rifamycinica TaxID=291594 RepID=A0A1C5JJ30_9ACTN|nr:MFS transporter [Micromonospora rifamycinica]SCG70046.1 Predicted arabinose efflux permease, MFS family [Micromonospora rifamycinica]